LAGGVQEDHDNITWRARCTLKINLSAGPVDAGGMVADIPVCLRENTRTMCRKTAARGKCTCLDK
jgi:hypothetical protein